MSKKIIPLNAPSDEKPIDTKIMFNKLLEHEGRLVELEQDQSLVKELKDQVGEVMTTQSKIEGEIGSIKQSINGIRLYFRNYRKWILSTAGAAVILVFAGIWQSLTTGLTLYREDKAEFEARMIKQSDKNGKSIEKMHDDITNFIRTMNNIPKDSGG